MPADHRNDSVVERTPGSTIEDLCRALGADPHDTRRIVIEPRHVEITLTRRGADGQPYAAGDQIATTTHTLPIDWEAEA